MTTTDLESSKDIKKITNQLLKEADAHGVFPTPVNDIVSAAGLTEVKEDLFDESILSKLPKFLKNKIEAIKYKVLAAIDRKEKLIYINHEHGNEGSKSFRRLHEVTHDILPWQSDLGYADDHSNLQSSVRNLFEREANFGAAELQFQNDKFTLISKDYQISFSSIIDLSQLIGSSIHAATRRFVETHSVPMALIVVKKHQSTEPADRFVRNEVIVSGKWLKRLPDVRNLPKYLYVSKHQFLNYVVSAKSQPNKIINGMVDCDDLNGVSRSLNVEVFNTTHNIHVLIWLPPKRLIQRAKRTLVS